MRTNHGRETAYIDYDTPETMWTVFRVPLNGTASGDHVLWENVVKGRLD